MIYAVLHTTILMINYLVLYGYENSQRKCRYGFVSEDVPEVSIAVDYSYRGKGIGTMLMKYLFSNISAHIDSVSLSVDTRNRAYTLYQKMGFKDVLINNGTAIMIVKVADFNIN